MVVQMGSWKDERLAWTWEAQKDSEWGLEWGVGLEHASAAMNEGADTCEEIYSRAASKVQVKK